MNLLVVTSVLAAVTASLGTIRWESTNGVSVTDHVLLLTNPATRIVSAPLPLRPLRWYDLSVTMRRGPGTRESFAVVFTDDQGQQQRWQPRWQFPNASRPDWFPISPGRQRYVQGLVVPAHTKSAHLELAVDQPTSANLASNTLWEISDLEFAEHSTIRLGKSLGINRLVGGGDMELGSSAGMPTGWTQWGQPIPNTVQIVAVDNAAQGRHVLRVTTNAILAATPVPVTPGSAWRISLSARGRGKFQVMAHSLNDEQPLPLRVGDPQSRDYVFDSTTWRHIEQDWFGEAPGLHSAQVVINVMPGPVLELDHIQFQPYKP